MSVLSAMGNCWRFQFLLSLILPEMVRAFQLPGQILCREQGTPSCELQAKRSRAKALSKNSESSTERIADSKMR